ncbi:MAG TPA: bifunctional DNA-binding transcriptional regulator/O6-methylguanine-DNA methyltransferase Ada [Thermoanaerobaculia bacterium]|jgi:AraC family transcriptional regulator of adaptative response/methylated-DNA-[protein]-cysteine methyltransferase|nr:bifunctional DNA-binding transcriptional regulator/O6-methylguanine-DNA methyltransferase Ada [Thermoanaerobaculia bacterium]
MSIAVSHHPEHPEAPDPETAWAAVLERDARFDGRFVYAVESTGVYCRPTCPSRRPRRSNVRFFAVPGEAESAGYRPCRRCRPRQGETSRQAEAVRRACGYLEAHLDEAPTLNDLAREVGMSPWHLHRTFKAVLGLSPKQYAARLRAGRFKDEVRGGESVATATYGAGYGSSSRLYEKAGENLGMTPGAYRRGGRGMRVRYTLADSPFGRLLVGATERGICAVSLGDGDSGDGPLEAELRREYPNAEIERDDAALRPWLDAVLPALEGRDGGMGARELPLDLQATAFQWRVWQALQEIPRGETRSYGEIAEALGRPGAARAVAQACASNRVALVVPCHRVVRGDGEPGGYRWGAERKRRILDLEAGRNPR